MALSIGGTDTQLQDQATKTRLIKPSGDRTGLEGGQDTTNLQWGNKLPVADGGQDIGIGGYMEDQMGAGAPPPGDLRSEGMLGEVAPVDTSIDASNLASGPAVQSEVANLAPPTDIDAATIGEYTPYSEVTDTVDPGSTVEGRLEGLLSKDSDYMKRAATRASQISNRRGLLNTSMAVGAAQGAAIDAALPIAQQDARANLEQQFRNQGYSNEAAKHMADSSITRENLQAGLEQDTSQFNQANLLQNERLNQAAQNESSRAFAAEQNRSNFAILTADLQGQLAGIDNALAMNLQEMESNFNLIQNMDSINGAIYQQMISEIGQILTSEDKAEVARAKINTLIQAAGVEFEFSTGQSIGAGDFGPTAVDTAPAPAPAPAPDSEDARGGGGDR